MKRIISLSLILLLVTILFISNLNIPLAEYYLNLEEDDDVIKIDENNFPDDNFRKYIEEFINKDGIEGLSRAELAAVTSIDDNIKENHKIKSLKGIEYFTNLDRLNCSFNQIKNLDLSQNTKLKVLACQGNKFESIGFNENNSLRIPATITTLSVSEDGLKDDSKVLKTVDVSQCKELKKFSCQSAIHIESLNLENLSSLKEVFLSGCTNLSSLNIDGCNNIETLCLQECKFTQLDTNVITSQEISFYGNDQKSNIEIIKEGNNYKVDLTKVVDKENLGNIINLKYNGQDISNVDGLIDLGTNKPTEEDIITYDYKTNNDGTRLLNVSLNLNIT